MYAKFLEGRGVDTQGRTVYDVLGFHYDLMEDEHEWIQWAFPNPRPSKAQPQATPERFTKEQAARIMGSVIARAHSVALLYKTLRFWGIEWNGQSSFQVKNAARLCRSLSGNNHNTKRMTRVIVFLYSTGQEHEAQELQAFLWRCRSEQPGFEPSEKTLRYWSNFGSEEDAWA